MYENSFNEYLTSVKCICYVSNANYFKIHKQRLHLMSLIKVIENVLGLNFNVFIVLKKLIMF